MIRYSENEQKYLNRFLRGDQGLFGQTWVHALEQEFAKKWGMNYAVAFNSGTSTLHAALVALGVGPGDEVITPALAPFMCTSCILHADATPVYADVDEYSFNIDPNDIRKKITPRTKAIIAVHLYGMPCDMGEILALGIPVIEDCAQAVLSYYKGRLCGTMGALASFSFETSKHISCGEGGMLVTNDEALAERARKFGNHGFAMLKAGDGQLKLDRKPWLKRHDSVGYNYRLSEIQAALALGQLERVEELVDSRIKSFNKLICPIIGDKRFITQYEKWQFDHINSQYTFAVRHLGDWQAFYDKLISLGGDPFFGAWSLPWQESVPFTYVEPNCPVAERIQPQIMQFKTSYQDINDAKKQAEILRKAIGELYV